MHSRQLYAVADIGRWTLGLVLFLFLFFLLSIVLILLLAAKPNKPIIIYYYPNNCIYWILYIFSLYMIALSLS